jgi:hypothetical protein
MDGFEWGMAPALGSWSPRIGVIVFVSWILETEHFKDDARALGVAFEQSALKILRRLIGWRRTIM